MRPSGAVAAPHPSPSMPARRDILIVRTDRIGDVVLTVPMIPVLAAAYPESRIRFLTTAYTAPLLRHQRRLDEVVVYEPRGEHRGLAGHLRLARALRRRGTDLAFLVRPRPELAFALAAAGIRERVGTGYRWYSWLLNRRVYEHRRRGEKHELEHNLSLLREFVPRLPRPEEVRFGFDVDGSLAALRARAVGAAGLGERYLLVHPGSGGSAPNLPAETFARVVRHLALEEAGTVVLAGSGGEAGLLGEIHRLAGAPPGVRLLHSLSLEEYAAVISGAALLVANSTGPIHLARAFDVPVVGFYCRAVPCAPRRWGPYDRETSVVSPDREPCATCDVGRCEHGNCLAEIPWERIQDALSRQLEEGRRPEGARR